MDNVVDLFVASWIASLAFGLLMWTLGIFGFLAAVIGLIVWLTNRNFDSPNHNKKAMRAGRITFLSGVAAVVVSLVVSISISIVGAQTSQAQDEARAEECSESLATYYDITRRLDELITTRWTVVDAPLELASEIQADVATFVTEAPSWMSVDVNRFEEVVSVLVNQEIAGLEKNADFDVDDHLGALKEYERIKGNFPSHCN